MTKPISLFLTLLLGTMAGCGGGGGAGTFGLGGTVVGLASGQQIKLLSGAGSQMTVNANGNFAFPDKLRAGSAYAVTVDVQPLGQTCRVEKSKGANVAADVANVTIACIDNPYTLGGTVSGLPAGSSVTVATARQTSTLSANGTYTFPFKLPDANTNPYSDDPPAANGTPAPSVTNTSDRAYAVTVTNQPVGATCTVTNGNGNVSGASVTGVNIQCTAASLTVGGQVSGLGAGEQVRLKLTGSGVSATLAPQTLSVNGPFTFEGTGSRVTFGGGYTVTIETQPLSQTCSLSNATASAITANITAVSVVCSTNLFKVAGSVTGLAVLPGGQPLVLRNGTETLSVAGNGAFQFPGSVAAGGSYSVTIASHPTGQTCTISNGSVKSVGAQTGLVSVQCLSFVWRSRLIAGSGVAGTRDDAAAAATFSSPSGVTLTPQGNLVVVDNSSSRIRQILLPSGAVTTIAGLQTPGYSDNASALNAAFQAPVGVVSDKDGNLYIADSGNHVIRRIVRSTGAVETFAGSGAAGFAAGVGRLAQFNGPRGLAIDGDNNLYVADTGNHVIRRITPAGDVTLFAGRPGQRGSESGAAASATFNGPAGVAVNSLGTVFVADTQNSLIRAISNGQVITIAGSTAGLQDGAGSFAAFNLPSGLVVDGPSSLYVTDTGNHAIRHVQVLNNEGSVLTIAGAGRAGYIEGGGTGSLFNQPIGITLDASSNLVVTDSGGQRVRNVFRSPN